MDLGTLFEADWYDKSPLVAVLRRNRGRWIHFTRGAPNRDIHNVALLPEPNRPSSYDPKAMRRYKHELTAVRRKNAVHSVPKLGVNPHSQWRDPKGIYFYPIDFLLTATDRIATGNQYGLDAQYYYIADLNLNDPNGVNLGTMTWEQVTVIAKRNGWYDRMEEFRQMPPEEQKKNLFSYAHPELPGSFFWHFIDRMVKDGKMTWGKAYRGVSYIRDPNLSIIHNNEPDQVLVLAPRLIKVIELGENKSPVRGEASDELSHWWHAMMAVIKQIRGEYGGDLTWMKKRPTLKFTKGYGHFELTVPTRSETMQIGLNLDVTYGRAYDQIHLGYDTFRKESVDAIVERLHKHIEQIAARKNDLLFTPILPIDAAKRMMTTQMTSDLGLSIRTRIYNSAKQKNYNSIALRGVTQREIDQILIKTQCYLDLKPDKISGSCNVWAGEQHLISAMSDYQQEFTEVGPMLANIASKVRENFDTMASWYAPETKTLRPRFHTEAEVVAFKGWAILNSGLRLDGTLVEKFKDDIAAFESYPDRSDLLYRIAYVMNSRY